MITPWYKEPWAWFIFILPFTAVVAGIATYIIANNEPDALVIGEYYKEGKAINLQLAKVKQAQKLGIKFDLKYENNQLHIKATGIEKEFPLLNVNFFHPTQEHKDFYLALTPDGNGDFRHDFSQDEASPNDSPSNLPQNLNGKWRITISPFQDHWKIQNTLTLPQVEFIEIVPDLMQAN
ncbi:MAG: FixH family protein [Colwellia sp.]|nr:FixH family protein [Colwellia sp.]